MNIFEYPALSIFWNSEIFTITLPLILIDFPKRLPNGLESTFNIVNLRTQRHNGSLLGSLCLDLSVLERYA